MNLHTYYAYNLNILYMHKHDKDVHAAVHKPPPCQRLARGKFTIIAHVEQSPGTFVVKGRKKRNAHPVEYICDLKTKYDQKVKNKQTKRTKKNLNLP